MWLRSAFIALLAVVAFAGAGTAEFTSPSMDQWGGGAEQVLPRDHLVDDQLAAGRHPNAVWVTPTSIAVVSGAPVALHNFPAHTTSTVAAGEEMILRAPYTRQVEIAPVQVTAPAEVHYYPPAATYEAPRASTYPAYVPSTIAAPAAPVADAYQTTTHQTIYEVYRTPAAPAPVSEVGNVRILDMPVSSPEARTAMLSPGVVHVIRESTYVAYPATTFITVR